MRVCSIHFDPSDFKNDPRKQFFDNPSKTFRDLKTNAVSHKNLFWKNLCFNTSSNSTESEIITEFAESVELPLQDFQNKVINEVQNDNESTFRKNAKRTVSNAIEELCGWSLENPIQNNQNIFNNMDDHNYCAFINNSTAINLPDPSPANNSSNSATNELLTDHSKKSDDKNLSLQLSILKEQLEKCKSECKFWKNLCKKKEKENKIQLQQIKDEYNKILSNIFTPGQIKKLFNQNRRIKWSSEDIAAAVSLKCVSAKAYRYLRNNVKLPLPGVSTLKKWISNFECTPGLLTNVLKIMKSKASSFSATDKVTVLSFDEMSLSKIASIDRKLEQKVGPHKNCQVVMARGLFKSWKQPIYYDFDKAMTHDILLDIIRQLYDAGYIVVATVCDMGPKNKEIFHALGCDLDTPENCFFEHPCDPNLLIHTFLDAPHLLKLLRNHFIDYGYKIDGEVVDKSVIEELLTIQHPEINICHKITQFHIEVTGSQRQNVKFAAKLFSDTVSKAILFCYKKKYLKNPSAKTAGAIFKIINDWFDLSNSKLKYQKNKVPAYGLDLNKQNAIILDMDDFIRNVRFGKHVGMIECQKGILRNNESLKSLFNYLKVKYVNNFKLDYIFTYRLNQDILENLFSFLQGMGGANDHPSALDCRYRIRNYIIGKQSTDLFSVGMNTEENDENTLIESDEILSGNFLNNFRNEMEAEGNNERVENEEEEEEEEIEKNFEQLASERDELMEAQDFYSDVCTNNPCGSFSQGVVSL